MARLTLARRRPGAADALERALTGDRDAAADPRVAPLLPIASALRALPDLPGPDPAFVAALAARLAAEAEAVASSADPSTRARPGPRTASRPTGRPVVLVVGRSLPRLVAGLAASVLVVAAILGVGSRGSLPGQPLYPVKQVLDAVQVRLAGSGLDRGTVQLAQAADHVGEAGRLVADGARPSPDDVDTALGLAADRTRDGRASLEAVPVGDRGRALAVQGRFLDEVGPRLEALQGAVPAGSLGDLTALRALLTGLATQVRQELVACHGCAPPLRFASGDADPTTPPGSTTTSTAAPTGATGSGGPAAPETSGSPGSPGAGGVTGVGPAPLPTAPTAPPSSGGGSSTRGGGVTATLPGVTATVGLPTVTVSGGGIGLGGGGVGVGGSGTPTPRVTLPLPGVTLGGSSTGPTLGVGGLPVVSSTCVLGLCPR